MQMPPVRRAGLAKDTTTTEAAGTKQDDDIEELTGVDAVEHAAGFQL